MKIRVVWIGKTKDANLLRLQADYSSRIEKFLPLETVELKDPRVDDSRRKQAESEKLLSVIDSSDRVVVLDPKGKAWTSEEFAGFVARHMREDPRRLTFLIGGYSGVSDEVRKRADVVWSLSAMTFTHDLSRVLFLEQLYRAFAIIHKHPYSK